MRKSKQAKIEEWKRKWEALGVWEGEIRAHWMSKGMSAEEIDRGILAAKKKAIYRVRWYWKCRTQGERARTAMVRANKSGLRLVGGQPK